MPAIRVLPPEVAARIAAGEVIERPASVVRELLDNAIDAGCRRLTLELEEGGLSLIRVVDDGHGISPEELELAFERHATSKLSAAADLAHVRTLGFRGEALPSIAAAADVEVTSRHQSEPLAVRAVLVQGRVVRREARPAPVGTSIAVRDLFSRLPARRKFLSSPAAEARQASVIASHYALAYPQVALELRLGGRRVLSTSGDGQVRQAYASVYGADSAAAMLVVANTEGGVAVSGLAGPPSLHRGNRTAISVFINGRWVQSRPLAFAVVDAYASQLPAGRHPISCLDVRLPDEDVDVNVHPAKAEVRFRDERAVARAVRHGVAAALDGALPAQWSETPSTNGTGLRARLAPPEAPAILRTPQPVQAGLALGPGQRDHPSPSQRQVLPLLRVVGQLASTFIVAEGPDGMYLLDQHAAHERVLFDRLLAARAGGAQSPPPGQPLLEPLLVELEPAQEAVLEEFRAFLEGLGLVLEPFGERAHLVRSMPPGLGLANAVAGLRALLDQLGSDRRVSDPFSRAAASVACHSSVRAGTAMAMAEMRQLLADLEGATSPRTCPHGRPTLVHLATEALERQFGRR